MDIIKFLDGFTNESLLSGRSSRRDMFGALGFFGKKAALTAIPAIISPLSTVQFLDGILPIGLFCRQALYRINRYEPIFVVVGILQLLTK